MTLIKPYKFLPKEDIENHAQNLLVQVQSRRNRQIKNYDIAEAVADYLDLYIEWTSLEPDELGIIAAMIIPSEQKILINENILELPNIKFSKVSSDGFKNSTIAHEIGHWMLHINYNTISKYQDRTGNSLSNNSAPFLCRSLNSLEKIEWQAQYFASCLLMPKNKLIETMKGRDLGKKSHFAAMAEDLGVTVSNLRVRLKGLDWITYDQKSQKIYPKKNFNNEC